MIDSPQLKLTRTLAVTLGDITKVLRVMHVVATQASYGPIALSVPDGPFRLVASEKVEITFRAKGTDYADMLPAIHADSVPYTKIRFGEQDTKAMLGKVEPILRQHDTACLITFLLLRVPVAALAFDDEDEWEKDEEHSYSRNGTNVIAIKPKPLPPEDYVGGDAP